MIAQASSEDIGRELLSKPEMRLHLEFARRATASQMQTIVDTVSDGILVVDNAQIVTMCNPACEHLFGYGADEIVGCNIDQIISSGCPGEAARSQNNHAVGADPETRRTVWEVVGRRKNGESFPVELSLGESSHEGHIFSVGVVRDLTERKFAEELRQSLLDQLTVSHQEQLCFSYVASHDLREPLRMVSSYCSLLSRDYGPNLDARGREFLSLATSAATHMRDLLDDLVDYGRLSYEGSQECWFDANGVAQQALEFLRDAIEESGAKVTCGDLPSIYGNPIRFQRLMQNLIGNAIKYVERGVEPIVTVSCLQENEFWRFVISDNGIGIEARHFERIFEPFKRLHGRSKYDGSGLGLSICRKIVEGAGGKLSLQSRVGEGSAFSFTVLTGARSGSNDESDH